MPRYTRRAMKSVQLSELGALAEDVRNGEAVAVRDGERVVAMVVPEWEEPGDEKVPRGSVPEWFFTERPPKFPSSVLEQLLHDRHSRDW
jgi:hypothetical protein